MKKSRTKKIARASRLAVEQLEDRRLLAAGLLGEYFNNINLSGTPAGTRVDPTVNFAWSGQPGVAGIPGDLFSVRWTGRITPRFTGQYTFITKSDDGVRLFINNQNVINNWTKHAPTENSGVITLTAGVPVDIRMEFFENFGGATAQLSWLSHSQAREIIPSSALSTDDDPPPPPPPPPPGAGDGLRGTYFDNMDFTAQSLTRVDPQVNFNWGQGSPTSSIQPDTFSVRWTGSVLAPGTETFTFFTRSDDGMRLKVNGQTLINRLGPQGPTEWSGAIALVAGQKYNIELDYIERAGGAIAELRWQSPSTAKAIVPRENLFSVLEVPNPQPQIPGAPGNVAATPISSSQIRVSWSDVANESTYKIDRSPDGTGGWSQIGTAAANATSFTNSGLTASTRYFYRVRAANNVGDSPYSAVVNATTLPFEPPPGGGKSQPDQIIQIHRETTFVGDNVYNATGDGQSKSAVGEFYPTLFKIRVYNDGAEADSFVITGPRSDEDWRVTYYDSFVTGWNGGKSITQPVGGAGWNTGVIQPGAYREYRAEVLALAAPGGTSRTFEFTARSASDASKVDVVEGTVSLPVKRALTWRRQNFTPNGTTYLMRIENQGNLPDQFIINAAAASGVGSSWNVQFFDDQWGGNEVTGAVRSGGGWTTPVLQPYETQEFRVVFSYTNPDLPAVQLTAKSAGNTGVGETITVNVVKPDENKPPPADLFPIGVWTQPKSTFDKWKSRGVNTLIEYQGDGATIEEWSQAARDRDMYYIRRPLSNYWLDVGDDNLLAWALPDEPEITTKYPPETLQGWINGWKQADPDRPIWVNFSGGYVLRWQGNVAGPGGYKPYQDLVDWDSSSIYPVTGWGRPDENPGLDAPGRSIDQLEKWSNGHPQFAVLESSDQELNWIQQEIPGPNPGQFRAEVWDSIIQGARGIIYFPMSFKPGFKFDNTPPEIVAEMTATNAKIQSLASVLQSEIDPPTRGLQIDGPLRGTWRVHGGKTYYVVLNFSDQTVTRNVTLQGVGGATSAVVHGENRSVGLNGNGTLTDTFAPYTVHVYQVG